MSVPLDDLAPDFLEPLVAWRVWRVIERSGELWLASVIKRTVWPPGEPLVAQCLKARRFRDWALRRPPHEAPAERCECGIYGAGLEGSSEYLEISLPEGFAYVLGKVALWGPVVECERGFRASYGYPLVLYVPTDASKDGRTPAREIAARLDRYDVPVELLPGERSDARALLRTT